MSLEFVQIEKSSVLSDDFNTVRLSPTTCMSKMEPRGAAAGSMFGATPLEFVLVAGCGLKIFC